MIRHRGAPSPNLSSMSTWNDQQRFDLLARYRRSGLTQDAFCAELRLDGIDLSPRTLRSWIARLEPPEGTVEACLQAVAVAMSELGRVRTLLAGLCSMSEQERHAAQVEPEPTQPDPPAEASLPGGIPAVPALSPKTSAIGSMPDGVPTLSPPRKFGRVIWG